MDFRLSSVRWAVVDAAFGVCVPLVSLGVSSHRFDERWSGSAFWAVVVEQPVLRYNPLAQSAGP